MKISLIQTSINRKRDLIRFIKYLNQQINIDLSCVQLIFVDQEDNAKLFEELDKRIDFTCIKHHRCSLSEARNLALPYVKGMYVAFPDDDCWYEPNTLRSVIDILEKGHYQGVVGIGMDDKGKLTNVFPSTTQDITCTNHCGAISYTMFYQFQPHVRFDENIGVGSPYNLGSGEETDYMLVLMEQYGYKIRYDNSIIVHHPSSDSMEYNKLLKKHYLYARGAGYLLRKHSELPLSYKISQFYRPFVGMVLYCFKNKEKARKSFYIFKGRIEGFFYNIKGLGQHTI